MADIIITIPKSENWEQYRADLDKALEKGHYLYFKVPSLPKVKWGDNCWVVHNGILRGYNKIVGTEEKEFTCSTTGRHWKGKFVVRQPFFYENPAVVPMKGFQGFRYYKNVYNTKKT